MRLHLLAAATTLTLALAGCASSGGLQPDGTPIDASSLKMERSLARLDLSPAAWPAQDWWRALGDNQLDALIDEALHDNPGLAVADARARAAQAEAGRADAARAPSVTAGASVSGARIPTTLMPAKAGGGHFALAKYADVSFKWGIDLWGGKRAAWESALAGQRVAAGIDNQIALKQSDGEVAMAQQDAALAERAVDATRSSLSVLLGKGPDRGLQIDRPQRLTPAQLAVPDNLPLDLLGHRADLVAARWRVEAASKNVKAAKSEFLPNVSLGAMAGVIALGGGNPLTLPSRFYQFGPSVSLPIFDGGRLRANLSGKDAQYELAVAQYNQTLVGALNEVADDLSAAHSVQQQLDAQRRAQTAAQQAWQLAEQRYRAGIGSYLEALVVRQQLLVANRGVAALEAQQVDLSVQLIEALGGGFQPQADVPVASSSSTTSRS
jgi:outer membrane protein TolC